jgi:hypothetical protein
MVPFLANLSNALFLVLKRSRLKELPALPLLVMASATRASFVVQMEKENAFRKSHVNVLL